MRNPTQHSIHRLLVLRQFPGFAAAELEELAVIAENVTEVTYAAGAVVASAGRIPALQLVVEGRIDASGHAYGPRQVFGTLEVIAGRTLATPAIAAVPTRLLQLAPADFANLLEDNFGLLSNVRRSLARDLLAAGPRASVRTRLPYVVRTESLGLVDRLVLLRHQITFATGRIQALAALAQATREIRIAPNQPVTRAGAPATASFVIIDGAVRTSDGRVLGPNDALGVVESLAEVAYAVTAEAITPVRVLETPSISLFDVIEDHTDLALALISRLASELLDLEAHAPDHEPLARVN
jgi:CRP-like cAMP-binding protein